MAGHSKRALAHLAKPWAALSYLCEIKILGEGEDGPATASNEKAGPAYGAAAGGMVGCDQKNPLNFKGFRIGKASFLQPRGQRNGGP